MSCLNEVSSQSKSVSLLQARLTQRLGNSRLDSEVCATSEFDSAPVKDERELTGGSRALLDIRRPTVLTIQSAKILVLPQQDRVVCNLPDREALLGALLRGRGVSSELAPLLTPEIDLIDFRFGMRLSGVLWSLALEEEDVTPRPWDAQNLKWQISSWPRFDLWTGDADLHRLAALFSSVPSTLQSASLKLALPQQQVRKFLNACDICRIPVIDVSRQPKVVGNASFVPTQLTELRARLEIAEAIPRFIAQ